MLCTRREGPCDCRAAEKGDELAPLTYHLQALLEILRDDAEAARRSAETLVALCREHGLASYLIWAALPLAWARAKLGDRGAGAAEFRQALADYTSGGNRLFLPFYQGLLAEIEAGGGDAEAALAGVDGALTLAGETGEHWFDGGLHRIRGEILVKQSPADPAPAEAAFLAAIAVAREQGARSFCLQAALKLAKVYQSTGRPADAHAVLAPALEGFSRAPEFPEIAEAQALLTALAEIDEVRNATAARQRRLQLQTAYGQAMMLSRGFGAEETLAAFTRAQELATGADNSIERFATHYGLWVSSVMRGELQRARDTAEIFRREAESEGRVTEVAVACRILGHTCLWQSDFAEARAHLEKALRLYDREREHAAVLRFGTNTGATSTGIYLALTNWLLGDLEQVRCARLGTSLDSAARAVISSIGAFGWVHARLGRRDTEITELREAIAAYTEQGNKLFVPFFRGLLAEIKAEADGPEEALAQIDEALVLATESGERWSDAFLRRIRGEILSKLDPANPKPAEEAFLTAIAVAQQQKARSFELRAAMSLARLWRDHGKVRQARELLAPVYGWFTEGFDTRDLKEAKALLDELHA